MLTKIKAILASFKKHIQNLFHKDVSKVQSVAETDLSKVTAEAQKKL